MIVATGKDTGMPAYIFVKEINRMEVMKSGRVSFTRVFLNDPVAHFNYFMDVTENPEEIKRLIKEERHILGRGAKKNEQEQTEPG